MKLQHLTVIFIIIMLPIMLILSQYIQTQIDLQVVIERYTTGLLNASHDAMTAYELNTMNNNYSEDANSKKRDVQASINTFFTSLANNLGVPGYIKQDIQPYIPAVVFTGYDGYYIYAKTTQLPRYTKEEEDAGGGVTEGDIKSTLDIDKVNEYALKPYIYYSAQYQKGNTDVVINYTLDNYITVYGNVNGTYISESGYLFSNAETRMYDTDHPSLLQESITVKQKNLSGENYYKYQYGYGYLYNPSNKTFQKVYLADTFGTNRYFTVTQAGYYNYLNSNFKYVDNISDLFSDDNVPKIIFNGKVFFDLYEKNAEFTQHIKDILGGLTVNDMVVDNKGARVRLEEVSEIDNNPYYYLKSDKKIFDDNLINFNDHKKEIIKVSIQENLKSALANYQMGNIEYKLPIFTEADWNKIFSNISIIAFMQDMPVSNGTYNNYVIATSSGNKEYVPDDRYLFY